MEPEEGCTDGDLAGVSNAIMAIFRMPSLRRHLDGSRICCRLPGTDQGRNVYEATSKLVVVTVICDSVAVLPYWCGNEKRRCQLSRNDYCCREQAGIAKDSTVVIITIRLACSHNIVVLCARNPATLLIMIVGGS